MSFKDVVDDLRNRHSNHGSLADQILVLTLHQWVGTLPDEPALKKRELEELLDELGIELECTTDIVHRNLTQGGYLDSFQDESEPEWWLIRERDGTMVLDIFEEAIDEESERAINHVQAMDWPDDGTQAVADGGEPPILNEDNQSLREEVAERLEIAPSNLESYLRSGEEDARREKLEAFVEAVEESDAFDKPKAYDKITWYPRGNQYHRSSDVLERLT